MSHTNRHVVQWLKNCGAQLCHSRTQVESSPPFTFLQDGNGTNWSSGELSNILQIWRQVSEDYAAFDVDVTTEEPIGLPLSQWVRAAIGGSSSDCEYLQSCPC
jgi:hypothetical protein